MRKTRSFTLVEMLIVLSMVSLIGIAIYGTLSNGVRIYKRLSQAEGQEGIAVFLDRFAYELRNTFPDNAIIFQGEERLLSFATRVATAGSSLPQENTIGQVSYSYNKKDKQLEKITRNYSQLYKDRRTIEKELLSGINSFKFCYYSYDQSRQEYIWQERWHQTGIPLAVRIELEYIQDDDSLVFTKTINIPIAPQPQDQS